MLNITPKITFNKKKKVPIKSEIYIKWKIYLHFEEFYSATRYKRNWKFFLRFRREKLLRPTGMLGDGLMFWLAPVQPSIQDPAYIQREALILSDQNTHQFLHFRGKSTYPEAENLGLLIYSWCGGGGGGEQEGGGFSYRLLGNQGDFWEWISSSRRRKRLAGGVGKDSWHIVAATRVWGAMSKI